METDKLTREIFYRSLRTKLVVWFFEIAIVISLVIAVIFEV